jgi:FAD:protein FMN transferase
MVLTGQPVFERIRRSVRTSARAGTYDLSFQAMGTHCQVRFRALSPTVAAQFQEALIDWVATFEQSYSRFLPESIISHINASNGWVEVDVETERLLDLCQELYFCTRGAFDPTALPLIQLWNWKADAPTVPPREAVQRAMELVGWNKVQRRPGSILLPCVGMKLDLGGIGKEYAVDRVALLAGQHGIDHLLVDFGQDIRVLGRPSDKPAWHIGLQDPAAPGRCWTGLAVTNQAIATSGDYFRCFIADGRRYGHIIDPRSGYPVDNGCRSVSVIAPSCTVAGALSTTAFILGPQEGLAFISSFPGVEGCVVTDKNRFMTRKFSTYATT